MSTIFPVPAVPDERTLLHGDVLTESGPGVFSEPTNRSDLSSAERSRLEQHAFTFACAPESYDIALSDGQLLSTPCGRGVVSVLQDGHFWHLAGGLLAPEHLKPSMIQGLAEISQEQSKTIAVYNVSETDAIQFRDAGFVVNKFGEEPLICLRDHSWSGKKFEWVRRQSNFCERAGIEIQEVTDADQQRELVPVLHDIISDDLSGRTFDQPLRLLEGELCPEEPQRRRLFLAINSHNQHIEAFLACSPVDAGRSWAFESYRKRKEATRGVTAYLFRQVIDQLAEEGCEQISLCLVPGRNVRKASIPAGDRRIQSMMSLWYGKLDFVFNVQGQDHFKSRFRPRYVDRYLCVAPGSSVRSFWSFLKTTGATQASWRNMTAELWRTLRRKK